MRSGLVLLSAFRAVSSSTCETDASSLLQAKTVLRHSNFLDANEVLKSVQKVANSFTKNSADTMTTDDVNAALGAANSALSALLPTFEEQHASAEREVELQLGEITSCHNSQEHGFEAGAVHAQELAANLAASNQCDESLAHAVATQTQVCDAWSHHATSLYSGLPGCSQPDSPEQLFATISAMAQFVNNEYAEVTSQRQACNEANTASDDLQLQCSAMSSVYEDSFCRHAASCHMLSQCHAHETEVYHSLVVDLDSAMAARQQQFIATRQSECLIELITSAMSSGTPIDHASLAACGDVSIDNLVITFPQPPEAPAACPEHQNEDPQCDPLPVVQGWSDGQADSSLEVIFDGVVSPQLSVSPGFASGNGWLSWNHAANSLQEITEGGSICGVSFKCSTPTTHVMVGMSSQTITQWPSIEYGVTCRGAWHPSLDLFEAGRHVHRLPNRASNGEPSDEYTLRINHDGHVEYLLNGALFFTSTGAVTYPLHVGLSAYTSPTVSDVHYIAC